MAKQLTFDYNGKNYVLEFTRNSVRQMESDGFIASDIETKPMTVLPALFAGAFIAHHRFEKKSVIEEIYSKLKDKQLLIEKLAEMYNEPISSLLDEPEEGNLEWTPNW
jgi:hypothetical protein